MIFCTKQIYVSLHIFGHGGTAATLKCTLAADFFFVAVLSVQRNADGECCCRRFTAYSIVPHLFVATMAMVEWLHARLAGIQGCVCMSTLSPHCAYSSTLCTRVRYVVCRVVCHAMPSIHIDYGQMACFGTRHGQKSVRKLGMLVFWPKVGHEYQKFKNPASEVHHGFRSKQCSDLGSRNPEEPQRPKCHLHAFVHDINLYELHATSIHTYSSMDTCTYMCTGTGVHSTQLVFCYC